MKVFIMILCWLFAIEVWAATNTANVLTLNTGTTNVTTGAFITLSTSLPFSPSKIIFANASTSVIKISYGASGSETDLVAIGGSATVSVDLSRQIPAGTRLAVEAVSGTASSGYITVSLFP